LPYLLTLFCSSPILIHTLSLHDALPISGSLVFPVCFERSCGLEAVFFFLRDAPSLDFFFVNVLNRPVFFVSLYSLRDGLAFPFDCSDVTVCFVDIVCSPYSLLTIHTFPTEINHRITIAIFISFVNRILLSIFYNGNRISLWKDMFLSSTTSATRTDTSHADRFKTLPPTSTIPVLSTFY